MLYNLNMDNKINLHPSIMCAKATQLVDYIKLFEQTNMRAIHFDVMDGHFVPNITLGTCEFNTVRSLTDLPIDVHFMVNEPEKFIDYFNFKQGDYISFHPETCKDSKALLNKIKEKGCKAGIAISPDTSNEYVKEYMNDIDFVLVMAVYPGFAGQKMVPTTINKIQDISNILIDSNVEIMVDGNTNIENTINMYNAGARSFVAGTSSVFKGSIEDYNSNLHEYLTSTNLTI